MSRQVSAAARRRRREVIDEWVQTRGWVCPGWNRDAHPSLDLTADHIKPRNQFGEWGPLRVLCRSCNSRRPKRIPEPMPPAPASYPNRT